MAHWFELCFKFECVCDVDEDLVAQVEGTAAVIWARINIGYNLTWTHPGPTQKIQQPSKKIDIEIEIIGWDFMVSRVVFKQCKGTSTSKT